MQFWSGTPFMETADALAIAGMLDESHYDGVICADHLIYPRDLRSPYPSPAGVPPWVGTAYVWDDAVRYVQKLTALRREYGRDSEPFEIMLALLEMPSADLYRRAEDLGITAVMCAPWMAEDVGPSDRAGCRAAIERFAETVIAKCR
jgi:hypothetical protein